MNIQIFGTRKSFETKKAERYFKERKIPYQFVDRKEKGIEQGRTDQCHAGGRFAGQALLDDQLPGPADPCTGIRALVPQQQFDKLLENQQLLIDPIVRNGRQATAGYCPDSLEGMEVTAAFDRKIKRKEVGICQNGHPQQQTAIEARGGGLLVSAAAGSGKTAVLTERITSRILDREHPVHRPTGFWWSPLPVRRRPKCGPESGYASAAGTGGEPRRDLFSSGR